MSQNSCCVPGCGVVRKDGVPLHRFPDPETNAEKFKTWNLSIGGEIAVLDHETIYDNRRVCHRHFEKNHKYPTGRLSKLAIPTLHIPDLQAQSFSEAMVISTSDISQGNQLQESDFNTSEYEPITIDDDCATHRGDTDPQPRCSYWQQALAEFSDEKEVPAQVITQSATADNISAHVNMPPAQVLAAPVVQSTAVPLETESELEPSPFQQDVLELDPDLMEILGEDPTSTKEYGSEIQKDLAVRLNHIATSGLSKKNRKELMDRYLVPVNCKFIKAPTLNPEIRASLTETQAKRDKGIENKQVLTSCALSSISEAITALISSGHKNPELLKQLMDTARILGDMQYTDSTSRRMFILSTVKNELKDQLAKTKIDEMLFGSRPSETLKSAKTIIKSVADLRSSSTIKSTAHKPVKAVNRPLDYRAHPAGHRQFPPLPPGGARYARAVPSTPTQRKQMQTTHNKASKTSSRQPQSGH